MSLTIDVNMACGVLNLCHREDLDCRLRGEGEDCEEGDEGLYVDLDEEEWRKAKTLLTFMWNEKFPNGINLGEIGEIGGDLIDVILDMMSFTMEAIVQQRRENGDIDAHSVYSRPDTV